jgi:hypothetical protein
MKIITEGNWEFETTTKELLQGVDNVRPDVMITIINDLGQEIYRGEAKDAASVIGTLPAGMRRTVQDGKTYTTRIGSPSWIKEEPTGTDALPQYLQAKAAQVLDLAHNGHLTGTIAHSTKLNFAQVNRILRAAGLK